MDPCRCDGRSGRLAATRADGRFNGIDFLEVDQGHAAVEGAHLPGIPPQRTLLVRCLLPLPVDLNASHVRITGGVRADPEVNPVRVLWAVPARDLPAAHAAEPALVTAADVAAFADLPEPQTLLVVRTSSSGDFSSYELRLDVPAGHAFDPRLTAVTFTFKVDCPVEFDCREQVTCPPRGLPEPVLDYLSRDFDGLRRLLLDRLSLLLPTWTDRNAADLGVTVVELFAYLGDRLAYAQDAVAAEAYLGTARRRVSVARHARLLDYRMHEGACARTWLVAEAGSRQAEGAVLPAGSEVCSADGTVVFHLLHDLKVRAAVNAVPFYTWGELDCCLPAGATRATLTGTSTELGVGPGDVLVLEEVLDGDGRETDVDPTHRWAVRLLGATDGWDPLTDIHVVEISWRDEDALPFPLCLRQFSRGRCWAPRSAAVARGNVVLAEHGALVGPEPLVPEVVPGTSRYRPRLNLTGLAHAVPYDGAGMRTRPAVDCLAVAPSDARAAIVRLHDGREEWAVRRDLLGSDRFDAGFVVEMEDDGRAYLRFGDDVLGRRPSPGARFTVSYRIGGGSLGNVGRDVLTQLRAPVPGLSVRNPLPGQGGVDREPVEQVRQWAPQAFRTQARAVTSADYAEVTQRYPQVQRATGTRRWTGSWYTQFVTVDRDRGAEVDRGFRDKVAAFLEVFRLAGEDVEVEAPVPVSLDIVLTVCVAADHRRDTVRRALIDTFSARDLPEGRRGFFHPDNFTFGQPVHLSAVVAAAMSVDGVRWVDTEERPDRRNRFQRWGRPAAGERAAGRIAMGRLEIARCDSDPDRPEHGRIDFDLEGGL